VRSHRSVLRLACPVWVNRTVNKANPVSAAGTSKMGRACQPLTSISEALVLVGSFAVSPRPTGTTDVPW